MKTYLSEAWASVASMQNSRAASSDEKIVSALDILIDRQLDRIAANDGRVDDCAAARRAIATAARRERHRNRLIRNYAMTSKDDDRQISDFETAYNARKALAEIFSQTSSQDAVLLLRAAQITTLQVTGISPLAARKRLSRLRARFAHLRHDAA